MTENAIYVQFSDSTEQSVVSYFSGPQDPSVWRNQGTIATTDARWKAYYDSQPIEVQRSLQTPA